MPRYITYPAFQKLLDKILEAQSGLIIEKYILGTSVKGRPIYGLKLGTGSRRVLMWSQMHGNESSTTRAIMRLLQSDFFGSISDQLTLYIIPVLNPDGAQAWTRVNANEVDLNRDAIEQSQPESEILYRVYKQFEPHYCFNLHGQRTIYGNAEGDLPAQVSFLAPAGDEQRSINEVRLKAMYIINAMTSELQIDPTAFIGRYNDAFNKNCVGDFFTSLGTPTVLFESGHSGLDYNRSIVSGYIGDAIRIALKAIVSSDLDKQVNHHSDQIISKYNCIPNIHSSYCDILIKNMTSHTGEKVNLMVMYQEQIIDEVLHFIPCLVGINDDAVMNAHRVIDLTDISPLNYDFSIAPNAVILSTTFEIKIFCE